MNAFAKRMVVAAILVLLAASFAVAGTHKRMLTSVTTNDVNRAAMAIKFTHNAMKSQGVQATLFFNVEGVYLVDKNKPSPMYPNGQSLKQMLEAFMADGGRVIACPMCMKNVGGMTNADLMPGVIAQKGAGMNAMFEPDTLVLSY